MTTGTFWLKVAFLAYRVVIYDDREPSDRLVPVRGDTNIWSSTGTSRYQDKIRWTPSMRERQDWGNRNLKSGDLVHRLGDARLARGLYPFSKVLAKITQSKYSHTAIVSVEDGQAVVYDTTKQSVRRQPFGVYMLDLSGDWRVQRAPTLDIAKTIKFIQDKWKEQPQFDYDLSPDDRAYYCVELAVKAYKAGGVDLGKPTMLIAIPEARKWKVTLFIFTKMGLKVFNRVWYVGNERHGIMSSPLLNTIHEGTYDDRCQAPDRATREDRLPLLCGKGRDHQQDRIDHRDAGITAHAPLQLVLGRAIPPAIAHP